MVKSLDDGRYVYDSMKACPFCQKPVAIEYNGFFHTYIVSHVERNPECAMVYGLKFAVPEGKINSYHNAIEMWNQRA